MITRGYFIGDIIDELASIAHQVETRCKLGLTDLNIYLENFFKEFLNKLLGLNLENLNTERCNEPGIDLGDKVSKKAFQITSQKGLPKIKQTVSKLTENNINDFDCVNILIIGNKQKTYTLDDELFQKIPFDKKNIWDINDICKKMIDLPIDTLQSLYTHIKQEVARIKIELEIPDTEGNFPTSVSNYIEPIPKPISSNFKQYYNFHSTNHPEWELTIEEVKQDFDILIKELSKLPRITREFYSFLIERRNSDCAGVIGGYYGLGFNMDRLRRICRYSDIDGEIRLLNEHGFIEINEPEDRTESYYLKIFAVGNSDYFICELVEYIENTGIKFQNPIVHLDFSLF